MGSMLYQSERLEGDWKAVILCLGSPSSIHVMASKIRCEKMMVIWKVHAWILMLGPEDMSSHFMRQNFICRQYKVVVCSFCLTWIPLRRQDNHDVRQQKWRWSVWARQVEAKPPKFVYSTSLLGAESIQSRLLDYVGWRLDHHTNITNLALTSSAKKHFAISYMYLSLCNLVWFSHHLFLNNQTNSLSSSLLIRLSDILRLHTSRSIHTKHSEQQ